jgi:imidazole glycerol-phosphate synthase subunit HisH
MKRPDELILIDTGVANTASITGALERAGVRRVTVANDPERVARAERVVLPGVGAFEAAMERLERDGLDQALRERVLADRPLLAICLGLQLLGTASLESPRARGLRIVDLVARPLAADSGRLPRPQQGWNRVDADASCRVLASGWAAFANGYGFTERPTGFGVATSDYGGRYVAGLERGALVACQFHPELSGEYGAGLLSRFVTLRTRPRATLAAGGGR